MLSLLCLSGKVKKGYNRYGVQTPLDGNSISEILHTSPFTPKETAKKSAWVTICVPNVFVYATTCIHLKRRL